MAHPNTPSTPSPRSAILELVFASGLLYSAWWLWSHNAQGHGGAALGAGLLVLFGLRSVFRSIDAHALNGRIRQAKKATMTVRKTQGRARLGTIKDAASAGMLDSGGYFLGELNGRELTHCAEGSLFCFAPPGTGKTAAGVIIQCLKKHFDPRNRPISLQVLDLSGEIYAVTQRRMRKLGYKVVCIAPWADQMARELGITIKDSGYNPLLKLYKAGVNTKDFAEMLAVLLLPGTSQQSESGQHFLSFGRQILTWGLLVLARENEPARLNLPSLRRLLMAGPEDLEKMLAETSQCDDFSGALRQAANKICQTMMSAGEEFSGAINTATHALNIYDDLGTLGRHISVTDGFDYTTIKDKPTCVYVMIPPERIVSHGPWLNLTLSGSLEDMTRDRTNRGVWCIYDEMANAGYLPNILKGVGLYRKFGIRFAFYCQTASQIRRLYGDDGLRDFLGMCDVIQAFGVRDPQTLRMLSELAGNDTLKEFSQTLNPDLMNPGQMGFSTVASGSSQAILRPEDIRTLPDNKQLIFYKNLPPFVADKVSYFDRKKWSKHADPNPYYRP